MKHPVDTSQWGEFVVGELFDCDTTKTFYPNKSELPPGDTPYITRSTYDNGISGYYDDINNEFTIEGNCLTIGAEGGIAFWQPKPFMAGVKVYTIRHPQLNELTALFIASLLNANSANYSYTNARVLAKIKAESIPLPLKPSADPSNYDSTDIDWTYMETVMSRVTARAKDRLANLPQPTDKKKTPVDTSAWGEFVVGELFDVHPTKAYKLKNSELLTTRGKNPVVVNSSCNNGIGGYTDQELTESGGILTFSDTTSGADTLFFQEKPFVGYPHVQGMYPKTFQLTTNVAKFMIASLRASINKYSWNYTNKLTRTFITSTTVKLPLKPSANPSDYTQDDIDWDYMESFMKTIETKAHNRLKSLQKAIA